MNLYSRLFGDIIRYLRWRFLALLALMVVDALQLGQTGQWTAVNAKLAIAAEPAHCLVEGSD